ncbi:MAG: Rrf2 family transcriptional regulator [Desulfobacterales bacterium]|nr:Rrf2 family transcriptional regulator [Desulfobacterales bacterium]
MLNQTAIYALRAMGFLAQRKDNEPVLSSTIAEEMDIPRNFLSKIFNRLVQTGFIQAIRGRNGGVALNKPASQIKLYEVVQLFMKIDDFKKCFLGINGCDGKCGLHTQWRIIAEQFDKLLNETTIDQIL